MVLKTPVGNDRPASGRTRVPLANMGNIELSKVSHESKPMDQSAKLEYSPVVPNGITSNRYEEMKSSS